MASVTAVGCRNNTYAQNTTFYMVFATNGRVNAPTTEAFAQRTVRTAGTYSHLYSRVITNSIAATSTFRSRKNTANGNMSLSVGSTATGEFEDASNTDAVVATDLLALQLVTGASGSNTLTGTLHGAIFAATTNTSLSYFNPGQAASGASTTWYYKPTGGVQTAATTETGTQQLKAKTAGTIKNYDVNVSTNGRGTATTFGTRKNGAAGNLSVSVTGSGTGHFEDTANSDAIAVGDLFNRFETNGTGAGNCVSMIYADFETTDSSAQLTVASNSQTYAVSVTRYEPLEGASANETTEANIQMKAGTADSASLFEAYVSANTVSAASTVTFRKNAANGNGSISITASTTGWFEDASHTDALIATDEINWMIATGGSGTSLTLEMLSVRRAPVTAAGFDEGGDFLGRAIADELVVSLW